MLKNQEKLLRILIREIKATVDISADPALAQFVAGADEDGLEFSLHLDPKQISKLVSNAEEQTGKRIDRLQRKISQTELESGALSGLGEKSLKEAFVDLGVRFGKKFADQALIKVQEALKDGSLTTEMIFNPNQVVPLKSIPINGTVRDLARLKPSYGERGKEKGKGEMLASVMFGFDAAVDEPDITIPGKGGWHIKSFGSEKDSRGTVQSGEGGAVAGATDNFVAKYKDYGLNKSSRFGKRAMAKIEAQIKQEPDDGPARATRFRQDLNALATISVTEPKGTAEGMLRLNRESEFFFIPANKVGAAGLNNGRLDIARDPIETETPVDVIAAMRSDSIEESFQLRTYIGELLLEELSHSDRKEIERIAKKQAKEEIKKTMGGTSFAQAVEDEINKALGKRATKDEIAEITKTVLKKFYRELGFAHNNAIDRIRL